MEKIVLITGASRGIGRQIAIDIAKKGNKVIANYNKSKEQAESLQKENNNIETYQADISKRKNVQEMIEYTIKKYGRIDVLINNAGVSETKLFTDVTDNDWERMINNNLYSAFCVTQEVAKNMIHQKDGCIINI